MLWNTPLTTRRLPKLQKAMNPCQRAQFCFDGTGSNRFCHPVFIKGDRAECTELYQPGRFADRKELKQKKNPNHACRNDERDYRAHPRCLPGDESLVHKSIMVGIDRGFGMDGSRSRAKIESR